jgi:putative ABC transport system permease protein
MLKVKLFRELWRARWQYASVVLMVTLGVAFLIAPYMIYLSLRDSYDSAYRDLVFESFGVQFNSAPRRALHRVEAIPGIVAAEGRLVEEAVIELKGDLEKRVMGRLISLPADRNPSVNQLRLIKGVLPQPGGSREIALEAAFARYHHLEPGEFLKLVWGSNDVDFRITGLVQSPEYLYVVRSKQELFSSPETFGVAFVGEEALGGLLGREGQINEVRIRVDPSANLTEVMRQTEASLSSYGPDAPVAFQDQPSYQMLQQDVNGFQSYAVLFPLIFLGMAALTISSMLSRLVQLQRPVIGLLRSLGASRGLVARHFLATASLVGSLGASLGVGAGVWLGRWGSSAYLQQLEVPFPKLSSSPSLAVTGFLVGVGVCALSAVLPARAASSIRPADAMRPVTPLFGRHWLRVDAVIPGAPLRWRLALRNLSRQPRRTITTVIGISGSMVVLIAAQGLMDSMSRAINLLLTRYFAYEMRVDFDRPVDRFVVQRIANLPGVQLSEGVLETPIEVTANKATYSALLIGLEPGSQLRQLVGSDGRSMDVDYSGVCAGPTVRRKLNLVEGQAISISLPQEALPDPPRTHSIRVQAFNEEMIGTQIYAPRAEVARLFRDELALSADPVSAVLVRADESSVKHLSAVLEDLPHVAAVTSTADLRSRMTSLVQTMQAFLAFMDGFGILLAFGILFNMNNVNVLERAPEVATLRSIGFQHREVANVLQIENLAVTLFGILLGLPLGRWFVEAMWLVAQTPEQQDLFTFDIHVSPITYITAAAFTFIASFAAEAPALRALRQVNLAKAVKERSV